MTSDELRKFFPHASTQFILSNSNDAPAPVYEGACHANRDAPAPAGQRIRQKSDDGLNKTERRFLGVLKTTEEEAKIKPHGITLLLANGVRYTPDFFVTGPQLRCYEVKGPHAWDDAIVKLKVAASVHAWCKFILVSPIKHGGWRIQEMIP